MSLIIATKVDIPWADDTSDCITLDFTYLALNGEIRVTSTANLVIPEGSPTPIQRTKVIRFRGSTPTSEEAAQGLVANAVLRVVQQPSNEVIATFEDVYSLYEEETSGSYSQ